MGKINVAIIGVGNCSSSLVQGIQKYSEIEDNVIDWRKRRKRRYEKEKN